jgi:hypothetical protein
VLGVGQVNAHRLLQEYKNFEFTFCEQYINPLWIDITYQITNKSFDKFTTDYMNEEEILESMEDIFADSFYLGEKIG